MSTHADTKSKPVVNNNIKVEKTPSKITEDEMDPLKLFVGNINQNVSEEQLLAKLTLHANVTSAIIVKKTFKDHSYGFVSLPTEDDVKKIMDLNKQDFYLSDSKLIFQHTSRSCISPGEESLVCQPLSQRNYDLSPLDSNKISIYMVADDVMMKILNYLPLKERICCEIVCCWWQALLYVMFKITTHLNLNENYLTRNSLVISKAMFSKLLLLTGDTLKSLSLSGINESTFKDHEKHKLLLIISQLCPNLEYLDMSNIPIIYFYNLRALKDSKNLKYFSAKKCVEFDELLFKELLSVLPYLKKIDVSCTSIKGNCFNILPQELKELNISYCMQVSKENLCKVNKVCKNLEVLEIEKLNADKEFLEELVVNCTKLRSLKLNLCSALGVSNQVKLFTKLTSLKIVASTFDLPNIANSLRDLEELYFQTKQKTKNMVDFGKFSQLKNVVLKRTPFHKQELMSLEKCKKLQYITITFCDSADQETIKWIIKGCPKIKQIECRQVGIDILFMIDINQILKNRPEKINILGKKGAMNFKQFCTFLDYYDTKKNNFDFDPNSFVEDDDGLGDFDFDFSDSD